MLSSNAIFAQVDDVRDMLGQPPKGVGGFDSADSLIIIGLVFLLAVALFAWAYFVRKRPENRVGGRVLTRNSSSRRRHRRSRSESDADAQTSHRGRSRRRRRRSEEFGRRNPTLGETGGLPPLRPEEPRDPPSSESPSTSSP